MLYIMTGGNFEIASMRDRNIKTAENDIENVFFGDY